MHLHSGSLREWHSARVLLSGDSPLIRTALALLISGNGLAVAAECANQPEALRRTVGGGIDLVVMDFDLDASRLTRMARLEQLVAAAGACPILLLTQSDDRRAVSASLQMGVAGVVLKSRPAEVLLRAMHVVLAGGAWLERSTVTSVLHPDAATDRLTPRETQIVELVCLGLQNKKIAARLAITENTVRHHLTSIFDKLSLANRMELMRYAFEEQPRA
ncbi:MAG TPA: response regulator transcription factor [Thermoanaerobaculia bacterium]